MEEEPTNTGWERLDDKFTATGISRSRSGAKSEIPAEIGSSQKRCGYEIQVRFRALSARLAREPFERNRQIGLNRVLETKRGGFGRNGLWARRLRMLTPGDQDRTFAGEVSSGRERHRGI